MTVILPHTIDAGEEIVASEHQENYEALRDGINAIPSAASLLSPYRVLASATLALGLSAVGTSAGPWAPSWNGIGIDGDNSIGPDSAESVGHVYQILSLRAADLAVPGLTTKLRTKMTLLNNSVAPARNFTGSLYLVSATGSGGHVSIGQPAAVAGTGVTINAPVALSENVAVGTDFDPPADGVYYLGVLLSGTSVAGAGQHIKLQLEVHHI